LKITEEKGLEVERGGGRGERGQWAGRPGGLRREQRMRRGRGGKEKCEG
jgi:hypothetical protein